MAFSDCSGLTSVTIPSSVTSIGERAFSGCSGLTGNLTIPASAASIGERAFFGCRNLEQIQVDATNPSYCVENGILYNKDKTLLLQAPSKLTGALNIPSSVTRIADGAFYHCFDLRGSFTLPEGLTSIGYFAFSNCSGLTGDLTLPAGLTSIESGAFCGCTGLTGVTLPAGITSLEWQTFAYCGLTSVTLPAGLTSIDFGVFPGCSALTSVTIPASVTSIGDWTFSQSGLQKLLFEGNAPQFELSDVKMFNGVTATVYYPQNNATWTEAVRQQYGGTLTWVPYDPANPPDMAVYLDITYHDTESGSTEHQQVKKGDSFTVRAAPDGYAWYIFVPGVGYELKYAGGERATPTGNMDLYLMKKISQPTDPETPTDPDTPTTPTEPGTPNTWQNTPDGAQYLGADGKPLTGSNWIEALGHRYVFDDNGILQTGNADGDLLWEGNQYYLNPNRDPNDPSTCYCVINYTRRREAGVTYYNQDGITYRGWVDGGDGKLLYQTVLRDKNGAELKDEAGFSTYIYVWGAQQIPEGRDPLDKEKTIAAGNYLFGEDGVLVTGRTGWYTISGSSAIAGEYYLTAADGQCALNTTIWDDAKGHRYLFGADGRKVSAGKDGLDVALTINGEYQTLYLAPNTDYVVCEYYRPRQDSKGGDLGLTYYNPDGITYRGWVDGGNGKRLYQTVMKIEGKDLYFIVWRAQYLPAGKDPVTKDPIPAGWYLFDDNGVLITKDGVYTAPDTKGVDHQYQVKGGKIVAIDGKAPAAPEGK